MPNSKSMLNWLYRTSTTVMKWNEISPKRCTVILEKKSYQVAFYIYMYMYYKFWRPVYFHAIIVMGFEKFGKNLPRFGMCTTPQTSFKNRCPLKPCLVKIYGTTISAAQSYIHTCTHSRYSVWYMYSMNFSQTNVLCTYNVFLRTVPFFLQTSLQ